MPFDSAGKYYLSNQKMRKAAKVGQHADNPNPSGSGDQKSVNDDGAGTGPYATIHDHGDGTGRTDMADGTSHQHDDFATFKGDLNKLCNGGKMDDTDVDADKDGM